MQAARQLSSEPCFPPELQEFFKRLDSVEGVKPIDLLVAEVIRLNPSRELLEPWITFNEDVYARNRIFRNSDYEALVIAWSSGQRSPIHNHRGSACAVYVVEGIASEILFEKSGCGSLYPVKTEHFYPGSTCGSSDMDVHQICNLQPQGSDLVSLHVYSPPLSSMELFSLSRSTFADYDDLLIRSAKRAAA